MLREQRRLGFFGGTFDPPHLGHLEMARAAMEALSLNRVYFVPAWQNPHKSDQPASPSEDRLAMLRLATEAEPRFGIWDGELFREGLSYTLHSVEHIGRVYPNCHLFWIIGSDQLRKLKDWHAIGKLVQKIRFILVHRPGYAFDWPGIPGLTVYPVSNSLNPTSGTEVRHSVQNGISISGMVRPEVEAYIQDKQLYRG